MLLLMLMMIRDDRDFHCEPVSSQQVQKRLFEAKGYHQAGAF